MHIPIASLTRTKNEEHPALWIGGGTINGSFKGVVHCTANLNLRKPIHTRKTENSAVLRQALVGIGPGDLIFYVEGKPPVERGNRSIRARACRIKDRQDAASPDGDGTEEIEEPLARRLFFDLVEENPKIKRGLIKGVHDGKDFVETQNGEEKERAREEVPGDGRVKWFDDDRAYGFVNRWNDKEDIFVHKTDVVKGPLTEGDPVEFRTETESDGPRARNVVKLTGQM